MNTDNTSSSYLLTIPTTARLVPYTFSSLLQWKIAYIYHQANISTFQQEQFFQFLDKFLQYYTPNMVSELQECITNPQSSSLINKNNIHNEDTDISYGSQNISSSNSSTPSNNRSSSFSSSSLHTSPDHEKSISHIIPIINPNKTKFNPTTLHMDHYITDELSHEFHNVWSNTSSPLSVSPSNDSLHGSLPKNIEGIHRLPTLLATSATTTLNNKYVHESSQKMVIPLGIRNIPKK